jgi:hypothetical protein
MTQSQNTSHDIFWLARYAHNTLAPVFAQAKAIEPSLQFQIEITFADEDSKFSHENHITIASHWGRDGMFQYSTWLRTKADVDRFAAKVEGDVTNLQPLDVTA